MNVYSATLESKRGDQTVKVVAEDFEQALGICRCTYPVSPIKAMNFQHLAQQQDGTRRDIEVKQPLLDEFNTEAKRGTTD